MNTRLFSSLQAIRLPVTCGLSDDAEAALRNIADVLDATGIKLAPWDSGESPVGERAAAVTRLSVIARAASLQVPLLYRLIMAVVFPKLFSLM